MNPSTSRRLAALLVPALAVFAAARAEAIPVFARKYGVGCTMCHSNYPRLNDFGYRYRLNGYRIPGKENEERTVLASPAPLAARAAAAFNLDRSQATPQSVETTRFQVGYFDLLSAGLLSPRLGYLVVYPPPIPAERGLADQPGTLEMANVIASQLAGTRWLNVRVGRFEPAYAVFSVKRQLTVSPRDAYEFAFPGGAPVSETQEGIELSGYQFGGFEYFAGWVNGASTNRLRDVPSDGYLRLSQVLGAGEGQTAGQRIGITAWYGRARPEGDPGGRHDYLRLAADASLNVAQVNLSLQGIWFHDRSELWGTSSDIDAFGGFAELLWLPRNELALFASGGTVLMPSDIFDGDIVRGTAGVRLYPVDNLALHLEYSHVTRQVLIPGRERASEDFATARVDWAF